MQESVKIRVTLIILTRYTFMRCTAGLNSGPSLEVFCAEICNIEKVKRCKS